MKKIFTLLLLVLTMGAFAQSANYSRVKIYTDATGLLNLASAGIPVDHGSIKRDTWLITDLSDEEIAITKNLGIKVEILIDDVQSYYINQEAPIVENYKAASGCTSGSSISITTPTNFNLGTMGGYLTYTECLAELDDMVSLYPSLITAKQQIGTITTYEGRPIYWVKISDNPSTAEPEAQILYNAVHHAREPAALSELIFYMWYMLENYGTNAEVQYLVDNTEMYFVPVVNPDGYVYNETTNPSGGGMWRKNRRNNGGGAYGVDNNRNYSYQYGVSGVSTNPSSDTYLGTGPFSEPENQAMQLLTNSHNFAMALNCHTYGDLLLYPFGYDYVATPENTEYVAISNWMVKGNQVVGEHSVDLYPAAGDSDDWGYGDTTGHSRIFSMTPEVGADSYGFWPPSSQIDAICKYMVSTNLLGAHIVNHYAVVLDQTPAVVNSLTGYLHFDVQRLGIRNGGNFTVSITPIGTEMTAVGSSTSYNTLLLAQTVSDSISYTLDSSLLNGQTFNYVLSITNGLYTWNDTLTKTYGVGQVAFSDDGSTFTNWSGGTWGTTSSNYYSASTSITDSPFGNYSNNTTNTMTLSNSIDLTSATSATLSFYATWAIEAGYDYCQVLASSDGGSTWVPLCGKYTVTGNANQDPGNPVYDGFQTTWVKEEMDLSAFVGNNILLRYQLVSDNGVKEDGMYIDDIEVTTVTSGPIGIASNVSDGFMLSQNMPNPAGTYTYINYHLPSGVQDAHLIITNQIGQLVKTISVDNSKLHLELNTSNMANGVYFYRIVTAIGSSEIKKMVLAK